MASKLLASFGEYGNTTSVRAVGGRVVVTWYERGMRRTRSRADTRETRVELRQFAQAKSVGASTDAPRALSFGELWERYKTAEFPTLRAASRLAYAGSIALWVPFIGPNTPANDIRPDDFDRYRTEMAKRQYAINQVRKSVSMVRMVIRWGVVREMVDRDRLSLYRFKVAKEAIVHKPGAYTGDEVDGLLRALGGGQEAARWRAWTFLMLAAHAGQRARAVLNLRWSDVDLAAGTIVWRAAFQKQGRALVRPVTWPLYTALLTADGWRRANGYTGDLVLFSPRYGPKAGGQAITYGAIMTALCIAEDKAGIVHQPLRGAHGLRRYCVTQIIEATGDRMTGLEYVGDTDPSVLPSYDQGMDRRIASAAAVMDSRLTATESPDNRHINVTADTLTYGAAD